jgi:DNA-binding LacI/PurR family transcriptional regulator
VAKTDSYDVLFVDCHEYGAGEAQRLRRLISRRVDDLFIVPMAHFVQSTAALAASDQPIVVADRMDAADGRFASVAVNNHAASETAFDFLAQRGNRDIMFMLKSDTLWNSRARIKGFRAAAARHVLSASCEVLTVGMTLAKTERAANAAFARRIPSTIFGASDMVILGMFQSVQRRTRRVPEDMALLAFDDVVWMSVPRPSVSTARRPSTKIAAQSWAMMSPQLKGDDVGRQRIRLPVEIIERGSTPIAQMPFQEIGHVC